MHTERKVIEPHRGLFRQRVAKGILMANCGGVKKSTCVDGVAGESHDINSRVVDGQASCRPTSEIIDQLRIERRRPTECTAIIIRTPRISAGQEQ